jgi:hypothetical protein
MSSLLAALTLSAAMKASVRYLRKAEPAEKRRTFFNDDMAGGVIVRPVAEVRSHPHVRARAYTQNC